jgi:hypothetical protein
MRLSNTRAAERVRREQRRRQRIDRLYDSLDNVVTLLGQEPDLQEAVMDWLDRAGEAPSASLSDHIQATLVEFETNYAMYRTDTDGTDNFPDECSSCEHYPHACPIFTKQVWETELDRMEADLVGAPESEVKRRYRRFAGRVGCHVIPDRISEWEDQHADLLSEGRDLRRKTQHKLRPKDETDHAAESAADAMADGGEQR